MAKHLFQFVEHDEGVSLRLVERRLVGAARPVPVDDWARVASERTLPGISKALALLAEDADAPAPRARIDGDAVVLAHSAVAALGEPQATSLGLPPSVPLILNVQSDGNIAQPGFDVRYRWLNQASRPAFGVARKGAFLHVGADRYRLPEPLYSVTTAIDAFREADTTDDATRFAHLAKLKEIVPDGEDGTKVDLDKYLRNTRIVHAAAFSLRLKTEDGGFQFDPILFGRRVHDRAADGDAPVSEAESLLPEILQDLFARQRFPRWQECRDRYPLVDGTYVYVDPALREALTVVRRVQAADPDARRRFTRNPRLYLKEELGAEAEDATIDHLFIETEQYSQRVVDVGLWEQVHLPWLDRQPNTWLPERFAVSLDGVQVTLTPKDVDPLREAVDAAVAAGRPTVEFEGASIPANEATAGVLSKLSGLVRPEEPEEPKTDETPAEEAAAKGPYFLIVEENLERVAYRKDRVARGESLPAGVPGAVRTELKPHQKDGLEWLQCGWIAGVPGMLLADDMGLGKSLQALAFLSWLQGLRERVDGSEAKPGPVLVVAPTGLLANWQEESEKHLHPPGLGSVCAVYGHHLARLKLGKERDIHRGEPMLDAEEIKRAEWVLTTYETLRDYHHSFASIRFSAAVFDEIQKVKNPTSQLARAAKSLNAHFVLGLTGTPIENRLEDLWAIMDIVYPGFLGHDLKSFSETFRATDHDGLKRLRAILMEESNGVPPAVLRRMKHDHLKGLPDKVVHECREVMPKPQADAYAEVVQSARSGRRGAMLETLHKLRGVSLHPIDPQQGQGFDPDVYCGMSARLQTTFKILEAIHRKGEKVLVFVESLDMQDLLAVMVKKRFGLKHRPLQINGAVAGESRQKAVHAFQDTKNHGFAVMILSPKAGGVGLTLTAANHVIHLSRWWNPAVEDQCTDRVYRIGQDRTVNVYYPMAVHPSAELADYSFDLKLNELHGRKRALSRDMLMPPVIPMADEGELYAATVQGVGDAGGEPKLGDATIDEIDRMEAAQFENWALRQMTARGYRPSRTPVSSDAGADGLLVHSETKERVLIQCKHRQPSAACDDEPIDDLLRARSSYGRVDRLIALTNAQRYTVGATERAARHGITLVARSQISMWPRGCF